MIEKQQQQQQHGHVNLFVEWRVFGFGRVSEPREEMISVRPKLTLEGLTKSVQRLIQQGSFELWFGKYNLSQFDPCMPIDTVLMDRSKLLALPTPRERGENEGMMTEEQEVIESKPLSHEDNIETRLSPLLDQKLSSGILSPATVLESDILQIEELLSRDECKRLIAASEKLGYGPTGFHTSYRSNTRLVVRDEGLAERVWDRLKAYLPKSVTRPFQMEGDTYELVGCNECFRFCKYVPGQHFSKHCDGGFSRSMDEGSMYTVNIYLNGGFKGGRTRFYLDANRSDRVTSAVSPRDGLCIVFDQVRKHYLHDGEKLISGVKYLLRTDLFARRRRRRSQ